MKWPLLMMIAAISVSCSSGLSRRDSSGNSPKYSDIPGIYVNSFDPDEDTLVLVKNPGYKDGLFFLIIKDSVGRAVITRGYYEFNEEEPKNADLIIGPPGYGLLFLGNHFHYLWSSGVHYGSDNNTGRTLILDTLSFAKTSLPAYNAKGRPYRFTRRIYESEEEYWKVNPPVYKK
ncbi:MAG: hypothetical protein Q8916_00935 [Bacteroidota bacterium]|nr:hypothetical protein [Bacteroidota bacterium]MDP4228951.1 hypothetical protein [Bacteroidota bacterium]MDP4237141.1 hypothetical protein [Bacteroidota bacterium]